MSSSRQRRGKNRSRGLARFHSRFCERTLGYSNRKYLTRVGGKWKKREYTGKYINRINRNLDFTEFPRAFLQLPAYSMLLRNMSNWLAKRLIYANLFSMQVKVICAHSLASRHSRRSVIRIIKKLNFLKFSQILGIEHTVSSITEFRLTDRA